MATTTALQAVRVPQGTDSTDVATQITNTALDLERRGVMVFASAAARTSAFTAAGVSPAAGMLCYRQDAPAANAFEYWNAVAGAWRVRGQWRDSQSLAGTTASVTFSGLPTYLRTLRISITGRGDTNAAFIQVQLRFGGDSSALYGSVFHSIQNGGATGGGTTTATNATAGVCGYLPALTATSGRFGAGHLTVTGWDQPTGHSTGCQWAWHGGYLAAATYITSQGVGEYVGTSALTSVTILPSAGNFVAGSQFQLIGVE